MMLIIPPALASDLAYLHAFVNQPIDIVLMEVLLLFGWIPVASVILWGFMEMWKDQRQDVYLGRLDYCLLAIDVPKTTEQSPKALENAFGAFQGTFSNLLWKETWFDGKVLPRFSLEIASIDGYIQYYIRCESRFRDLVEAALYAQYPDAQIIEVEDYVNILPSKFPDPEWDMWGTEFHMKEAEYLPFRTWPSFEHSMSQELKDPLAVLLEQMSRMRVGECFFFQIVFSVTKQNWQEDGVKFINKVYGIKDSKKSSGLLDGVLTLPGELIEHVTGVGVNSVFGIGPETAKPKDDDIWRAFKITLSEKAQVEAVANKISKVGFKTKVRILYFGKKGVFSKGARAPIVKGFLLPFSSPGMNGFGMYSPQIPKSDYFWQRWVYNHRQTRVTQAFKKRSYSVGATPKIMCAEELATLWHFPTILIKAPLVKKTESRRAEPPVSLPIASEDEPMYKSQPLSQVKKEAPPINLPTSFKSKPQVSLEPEIKFEAPIKTQQTKIEMVKPAVPAKPVVSPKNIPESLRLLLDPSVELENVNLPSVKNESESTPPNLPL